MSLQEVQSEPKMPTASPPSESSSWIGAGEVVALPRSSAPRPFSSHWITTLPDGADWCVVCGPEPRPDVECLPGVRRCDVQRCESCRKAPGPGLINDHGFYVCGHCVNGGRA